MKQEPPLILGINGSIGSAIARKLMARGQPVRALVRDPRAAAAAWNRRDGIEWIAGDAMDRGAVVRAAEGAGTIIHAVSPPGYRNWSELVLPMIDNSIAAARAAGARIVLPGTVYNFDPAETPLLEDHSPQRPKTEKGRIRAELERRLEDVSGECPVLIVRAGDYIGPDARSSWFAQALVRPGGPVRRLIHPGKGAGHSWAYLPDLAEAFVQLLAIPDRLRPFERLQFQGIWDPDGRLLPRVIREVVGCDVPEHGFPWWLMRALAPFGGFPQAVRDIEPYWCHPIRFDNSRLVELLGEEPHTPVAVAVRDTLRAMGCLDDAAVAVPLPT